MYDEDIPSIDKPPKKGSNKYARKKPKPSEDIISVFDEELRSIQAGLAKDGYSEDKSNLTVQISIAKTILSMLGQAETSFKNNPSMQSTIAFTNLVNTIQSVFVEIRRVRGDNSDQVIDVFDNSFDLVIKAVLTQHRMSFNKLMAMPAIPKKTLAKIEAQDAKAINSLADQLNQIREMTKERTEALFRE